MSLHLFHNKTYVTSKPTLLEPTKKYIDKILENFNFSIQVKNINIFDNGLNYDTYSIESKDGKFFLLKVSFDSDNIQLKREVRVLKKLNSFASGKLIGFKNIKIGEKILCALIQFPNCVSLKNLGRDFFLKNSETFFYTHKVLIQKVKPKRSKSGYLKELVDDQNFSKNFTTKTKSLISNYTDYDRLENILKVALDQVESSAPNVENPLPCLSNINSNSIYLGNSLFFFDKIDGFCNYHPYLDLCDIILNLIFEENSKKQIISSFKSVYTDFDNELFDCFFEFCIKKKFLESISSYVREVYELRCLRVEKITEIISMFHSNYSYFRNLSIFIDNQDFLFKTITEPVLGVKA